MEDRPLHLVQLPKGQPAPKAVCFHGKPAAGGSPGFCGGLCPRGASAGTDPAYAQTDLPAEPSPAGDHDILLHRRTLCSGNCRKTPDDPVRSQMASLPDKKKTEKGDYRYGKPRICISSQKASHGHQRNRGLHGQLRHCHARKQPHQAEPLSGMLPPAQDSTGAGRTAGNSHGLCGGRSGMAHGTGIYGNDRFRLRHLIPDHYVRRGAGAIRHLREA